MYQRLVHRFRNYLPQQYTLLDTIGNAELYAPFKMDGIYRGIVVEKLKDNRYKIFNPKTSKFFVTARSFFNEPLKTGDPVWVVFENRDIMLPVAIRAALDDPVPTFIPLQSLAQINSSLNVTRVNYESFLAIEGQVNIPRSMLAVSRQFSYVQVGKGRVFVSKGNNIVKTQINYVVETSPPVVLTSKTTGTRPVISPTPRTTVPNFYEVPLQTDKGVAYVPILGISNVNLDGTRKRRQDREKLFLETVQIHSNIEDIGEEEGVISQMLSIVRQVVQQVMADNFNIFIDHTRGIMVGGIDYNKILSAMRMLFTNVQTLNMQLGFVANVKSGVVYEAVRKFLVKEFKQADIITRFINLQNITQYFFVIPDLAVIQQVLKLMSTADINKLFRDLGFDIGLVSVFLNNVSVKKIAKITGLGRDQIQSMVDSLGETLGSAIQVLLLLQKAIGHFMNVLGQFLDSHLIQVTDQKLFDLAVLKIFAVDDTREGFDLLDKYRISFNEFLGFITAGVDIRKPISELAFHGAELLLLPEVFWYDSGNIVMSPTMLLEKVSFVGVNAPVFVPNENKYVSNLRLIFNSIFSIVPVNEREILLTLDLKPLGNSASDTIMVIDKAVKLIDEIMGQATQDNIRILLEQMDVPGDIHSNPLLLCLNKLFTVFMYQLLKTTDINLVNFRAVLRYYKSKLLLLRSDISKGKIKLHNITVGSGFVVRMDNRLGMHSATSQLLEKFDINPVYPDFGLDTDKIPVINKSVIYSPDVEVKELKVDEVPLIQVIKFRPTQDQPFKYYIVFKPTQMEFWVDGDNNVVIRANKLLLESKEDIIMRAEKNIMMVAGGGMLQLSGTKVIPESMVQGILAGNHVIASSNNINLYAEEQIKTVSVARTARRFNISQGPFLSKPIVP